MYIEVVSYVKNIVSNTNRSTQAKNESRETISYVKHISSSVQLQIQAKKESRETTSYAKHIQTLVNRHRREFVSVNSFILPVHFETVIRQNQTLTKRNISSYMKPIQTNISCQTKKEILKVYAYAHHEENLSNIYAIENPSCPSCVEVI